MQALDRIRCELDMVEPWKVVSFSTCCAERVTPIIQRLARDDLIQLWEGWLRQLWSDTSGEKVDASTLLAAIDRRPEAHFGDSHYADYYVMRALGILFYALSSTVPQNAHQNGGWASEGVYSFAADFDFVISDNHRVQLLGGVAVSEIKDLEVSVQERTLALLRLQSKPSISLTDKLREEAKRDGQVFYKLLPEYCDKHGWAYT